MGLLTRLFDKGRLNPKMMVKTLQDHEDRIKALEEGSQTVEEPSVEEPSVEKPSDTNEKNGE